MARTFTIIAAGLGLVGVALGAFGAHGLEEILAQNERVDAWDLAAHYQMIHAVALLGTAWAADRFGGKAIAWAGWLFVGGVAIFSGTLYALALTNIGWLGAITPIGGTALIVGWALLLVGAVKAPKPMG